jgi:4-nitrophenyl phosphatase
VIILKKYKGFLIDLDGTMYKGTEKIEAAGDFIEALEKKNLPYLFVTNNSSKTPEDVAKVLNDFNINASSEHVFTSSMATANLIAEEKHDAKVFMIGENGLETALLEKGLTITSDKPDYVVIGIDRQITYEKLAIGALAIRNGAKFISTNGDIAMPTERGLMPGNGSLTAVLAVSTRVNPVFIGKPESIIMEQALLELGVSKEDTLMIGDNYDTDILAGVNAGLDTLLVHSGVTLPEHLVDAEVQPTYTVNSLAEWIYRL